ncbi:MAG: acetate kinase [Firmicutes bacterium]|nr:acetate kinase [Bacillota bacterium]
MNVLVLNCGSSSLKFQLIDTASEAVLKKGEFERIGSDESFYSMDIPKVEETKYKAKTHTEAVAKLFELMGDLKDTVCAIGHRVVHGGAEFSGSVLVTERVLKGVEEVSHFAPLHNPANIGGVRACIELLPKIPNVLVFDTSFHSTMQPKAYRYGIANADYEKFGVRKYGFHGTSYAYVAREASKMMNRPLKDLKMIIAHIGNGASICAIDGGKSVDTSMGLTPLEGLIMGTRAGDIDTAAAVYLAKKKGLDFDGLVSYLNSECGMLGMAGVNDMRPITTRVAEGEEQATIAFESYIHRITKHIGALVAVLGGVDAICWTAGVGTNRHDLREKVMSKFEFLGAKIDPELNILHNGIGEGRNRTGEISEEGSTVRTFVIATNEELQIAREAVKILETCEC